MAVFGTFGPDKQVAHRLRQYLGHSQPPLVRLESRGLTLFCQPERDTLCRCGEDLVWFSGHFYQKPPLYHALEIEDEFPGSLPHADARVFYYMSLLREWPLLQDIYAEFAGLRLSREGLTLVADRAMTRPVFYALQGQTLVFGNCPLTLVRALGREARFTSSHKEQIKLFGTILDGDSLCDGLFFVPPGHGLVCGLDGHIQRFGYLRPVTGDHNHNLEKKELAYELCRLFVRAVELVTREQQRCALVADSLPGILCAFVYPFERLPLDIWLPDMRLEPLFAPILERFTDAPVFHQLTGHVPASTDMSGALVFPRMYHLPAEDFPARLTGYLHDRGETVSAQATACREYLLRLAEPDILTKIRLWGRDLRNPLQECFWQQFLRTIEPELVVDKKLFHRMGKNPLFASHVNTKRLERSLPRPTGPKLSAYHAYLQQAADLRPGSETLESRRVDDLPDLLAS